jgi:hypothetical protein
MTQKPMLRGEVGARALRNPVEEGGGKVYGTYKRARRGVGGARAHAVCRASGALKLGSSP